MSKLPAIKPHKIANVLKRAGFRERFTKSGHRVYTHPDGRRTLVSFHPKSLSRIELKTILKQAKLSEEAFLKLF